MFLKKRVLILIGILAALTATGVCAAEPIAVYTQDGNAQRGWDTAYLWNPTTKTSTLQTDVNVQVTSPDQYIIARFTFTELYERLTQERQALVSALHYGRERGYYNNDDGDRISLYYLPSFDSATTDVDYTGQARLIGSVTKTGSGEGEGYGNHKSVDMRDVLTEAISAGHDYVWILYKTDWADIPQGSGVSRTRLIFPGVNTSFTNRYRLVVSVAENHYPAPTFYPRIGQHPRLYVTQGDIPELVARTKDKMFAAHTYSYIKNTSGTALGCNLPYDANGNFDALLIEKIHNRAFMYLIGNASAEHAQTTVAYARQYMDSVVFPDTSGASSRLRGRVILMAAIVYDWCYDQLTAADQADFIACIKGLAADMEVGYPPIKKNSIHGHMLEGEIFQYQLAAGIAVFDEDPEIYNLAAGRLFSEMVPAMRYFYDSDSVVSGNAYGMSRYEYQIHADRLMRAIGYPDIFGQNFKNAPYKWIYERLPNGMWFKDGDDFLWSQNGSGFYYREKDLITMRYAGQFGNAYFARQMYTHMSMADYNKKGIFVMLFTDPGVGIKEPDDLPLARYTKDPLTSLVARTSWQNGLDADTAMVRMSLNNFYYADHMHANTGSFQLYYKGMLALEGGLYEGLDSAWGGSHFFNYSVRTIAGNSLLVFDPNETWIYSATAYSNDGGQRSAVMAGDYMINSYEKLFSDHARTAVEKAHYIGPNDMTPAFSYLKGDLTNAYTDKIEAYTRSMVFMDLFDKDYPAAFVVFDRVESSNAEFKKTFLLQSELEPEIDGDTTVITRTDHGQNGKLVNKTLAPQAAIRKIGGEGMESWVNGQNYPNRDYLEDAATDQGHWRVEVSPAEERKNDIFLNAMYVTDADGNLAELPMIKEENARFIGVSVSDRLVMFSKSADLAEESFSITVKDNGYEKILCLITDVREGLWEIGSQSESLFVRVRQGENVLYAELAPGTYSFSPAGDSAQETQFAAPRVEKEEIGDFQIMHEDLLIYQPSPTKLIGGIPYVSVKEGLGRLGAEVCGLTLKKGGSSLNLSGNCVDLNGEAYAPVLDLQAFLGVSMVYDDAARLLKVTGGQEGTGLSLDIDGGENTVFAPGDPVRATVFVPQNMTDAKITVGGVVTNTVAARGENTAVNIDTGFLRGNFPALPVTLQATLDGCAYAQTRHIKFAQSQDSALRTILGGMTISDGAASALVGIENLTALGGEGKTVVFAAIKDNRLENVSLSNVKGGADDCSVAMKVPEDFDGTFKIMIWDGVKPLTEYFTYQR